MDVQDLFRALFVAGLPMFALSFLMVWWALHRGRLDGTSFKELQQSIQSLGKQRKEQRKGQLKDRGNDSGQKEKMDPALEKWFRFGGGFYGLVALYTWLLIEWDEVADFFTGLGEVVLSFDFGRLIQVVINLFIESIMNFVAAIAWPAYWLRETGQPWVWLLVAYGGYWLGVRAAQRAAKQRWADDAEDFVRTLTGRDDDAS